MGKSPSFPKAERSSNESNSENTHHIPIMISEESFKLMSYTIRTGRMTRILPYNGIQERTQSRSWPSSKHGYPSACSASCCNCRWSQLAWTAIRESQMLLFRMESSPFTCSSVVCRAAPSISITFSSHNSSQHYKTLTTRVLNRILEFLLSADSIPKASQSELEGQKIHCLYSAFQVQHVYVKEFLREMIVILIACGCMIQMSCYFWLIKFLQDPTLRVFCLICPSVILLATKVCLDIEMSYTNVAENYPKSFQSTFQFAVNEPTGQCSPPFSQVLEGEVWRLISRTPYSEIEFRLFHCKLWVQDYIPRVGFITPKWSLVPIFGSQNGGWPRFRHRDSMMTPGK